jgi:hypothetical protein
MKSAKFKTALYPGYSLISYKVIELSLYNCYITIDKCPIILKIKWNASCLKESYLLFILLKNHRRRFIDYKISEAEICCTK